MSIAALLHELDERSPAGFAIALHIRFSAPTYLFQSYPKRWTEHYSAAGMVVNDPTVRWGLNNAGRIRWSELERIDSHGVLAQARRFGIMNGATVAVLRSGSRSIASFARADREYDDAEMTELEEVLADLHLATVGPLSERELKALTQLSVKLTR